MNDAGGAEAVTAMDDDLAAALDKIEAGAVLEDRDWQALTSGHDLIAFGIAADTARRRRHADRTTFVQLVPVPVSAPVLADPLGRDAGEVRLEGRPATAESAVAAVRALAAQAGGVPVTGFAYGDLDALCGHDPVRLGDLLVELREAGLAQLASLAADALADPEPVVAVLRGSGSEVSSLTFGEAVGSEAWRLMRRVKSWGGIGSVCRTLAPLALVEALPPTTGYNDLRQVALARLLVDNIDSIQVDWSRHGPKLAQVALTFGADDVDAVPAVATSEQGWRRSPREEIRRNITAAGFSPVPRNGRFEALES